MNSETGLIKQINVDINLFAHWNGSNVVTFFHERATAYYNQLLAKFI